MTAVDTSDALEGVVIDMPKRAPREVSPDGDSEAHMIGVVNDAWRDANRSMSTVAIGLASLRDKHGLSVRDLAKRTDVSKSHVGRLLQWWDSDDYAEISYTDWRRSLERPKPAEPEEPAEPAGLHPAPTFNALRTIATACQLTANLELYNGEPLHPMTHNALTDVAGLVNPILTETEETEALPMTAADVGEAIFGRPRPTWERVINDIAALNDDEHNGTPAEHEIELLAEALRQFGIKLTWECGKTNLGAVCRNVPGHEGRCSWAKQL